MFLIISFSSGQSKTELRRSYGLDLRVSDEAVDNPVAPRALGNWRTLPSSTSHKNVVSIIDGHTGSNCLLENRKPGVLSGPNCVVCKKKHTYYIGVI